MEILQFGEIRSPILPGLPPKLEEKGADKKPIERPAAPEHITPGGPTPAPNPI
jgi:hypothetical protein